MEMVMMMMKTTTATRRIDRDDRMRRRRRRRPRGTMVIAATTLCYLIWTAPPAASLIVPIKAPIRPVQGLTTIETATTKTTTLMMVMPANCRPRRPYLSLRLLAGTQGTRRIQAPWTPPPWSLRSSNSEWSGNSGRNGSGPSSSSSTSASITSHGSPLLHLLHEYGYGQRVIHLSFPSSTHDVASRKDGIDDKDNVNGSTGYHHRHFYYWAEFQDQGRTRLCQIVNVILMEDDATNKGIGSSDGEGHSPRPIVAPKLEIQVMDDEGDNDDYNGDDDNDDDGHDDDVDGTEAKNKRNQVGTSMRIVDVGQITTIWDLDSGSGSGNLDDASTAAPTKLSGTSSSFTAMALLNVGNHYNVEETLEAVYRSRVGRGRGDSDIDDNRYGPATSKSLSKKQIAKVAASAAIATSSNTVGNQQERLWMQQKEQERIETVFRQVIKTGPNYARLIDSAILRDALDLGSSQGDPKQPDQQQQRRQFVAEVLGDETFTVGRFKRMPCMWLGNGLVDNDTIRETTTRTTTTSGPGDRTTIVSFINGGWLVVDQSVRASTEGRTFAATAANAVAAAATTTNTGTTSTTKRVDSVFAKPTVSQLAAIERITHRLECLAMGEDPSVGSLSSSSSSSSSTTGLEKDVRATLLAMDLPPSPDGARQALLRTGQWSEVRDSRTSNVRPWSLAVLEAAEWYTTMDEDRRRALYDVVQTNKKRHGQQEDSVENHRTNQFLEGRIDLTHLPCVCVDTARARFRDDAIGIRPRASTGRKVDPKVSKWEILLHIADVSDIYAAEPSLLALDSDIKNSEHRAHLQILEQAASSRGTSRYDLPLGPLHILPPDVLESLALETIKPREQLNHVGKETVNRCVTIWVFIDEQSGKVIDAGVERTLISRPLALSFGEATELLADSMQKSITGSTQEHNKDDTMSRARAILAVAERNIQRWGAYRRTTSDSARAREERLAAYEIIGQQIHGTTLGDPDDDGTSGFQRSRGHRLVDAAMDLYGYAINGLMRRSLAPLPRVAGTHSGRVATGPLRRYVDGVAQRQALSVLCGYGGRPLTKQECIDVGLKATEALNAIVNVNVSKQSVNRIGVGSKTGRGSKGNQGTSQQLSAIRMLKMTMKNWKSHSIQAMTTGKGNEVVIMGAGAIAVCKGMKETLRPGKKVMVTIEKIDDKNGKIIAVLDDQL